MASAVATLMKEPAATAQMRCSIIVDVANLHRQRSWQADLQGAHPGSLQSSKNRLRDIARHRIALMGELDERDEDMVSTWRHIGAILEGGAVDTKGDIG